MSSLDDQIKVEEGSGIGEGVGGDSDIGLYLKKDDDSKSPSIGYDSNNNNSYQGGGDENDKQQQSKQQQQQTNSGSADFVKKLFQMLEDDNYKKIVRWTEDGDSFIIIDTNEFTKDILPKHFKHSNFASFVRQLNKYDFHKVKVSTEDKKLGKNKAETGDNIWEFKHPDFKIHDRDSLENIKRKGPAQKKTPDEKAAETMMNLKNQMKIFTNETKELHDELKLIKSKYNTVIETLLNMEKENDAYHAAFTNLAAYLTNQGIKVPQFDMPMSSIRQSHSFLPSPSGPNKGSTSTSTVQQQNQFTPDRRRTSSSSSIPQAMASLHGHGGHGGHGHGPPQARLQQMHQLNSTPTIPTTNHHQHQHQHSATSTASVSPAQRHAPQRIQVPQQPPATAEQQLQAAAAAQQQQQQQGPPQTTPQQQTPQDSQQAPAAQQGSTPQQQQQQQQNTVTVPMRPANSPFHVLLVEDDAVCIQLCRKFLMKYGCTVEVVTDGLSAISYVEKVKYDLVLMDIVMPNLDGATATSVIRSFDSTTPIIAMTGNIQDNDLLTYLRNGMTDILAKPFTQHDLFAMLEKHLRNGGLDLSIDDPMIKKQRLA